MITRRRFSQSLVALPGGLFATGAAGARTRRSAGPDFRAVIARAAPAVVAVGEANRTLGSGFVIGGEHVPDARMIVATAAHVVTAATSAVVLSSGGWRSAAKILASDPERDVALLEAEEPASLAALSLSRASAPPQVGEWIVVLGNPFGAGVTATIGIVSALPGTLTQSSLAGRLQLNAAVNPGNSGGPVLNLQGEAVAIATANLPGGYGLGFATPVSALHDLLATLSLR